MHGPLMCLLQDEARIQERVLADAQAVRQRHKHARVARCLQLNRVHHHKVMAEYGKAVVLTSIRFFNPSGEPHTFQLKACITVNSFSSTRFTLTKHYSSVNSEHWKPHRCVHAPKSNCTVQIDAPDIVRPINSHGELQALQHALGQRPDADKDTAEYNILAGDLLHLRAQEVLTLPFLMQVQKGAQEESFSQKLPNSQLPGNNASSHTSPDAVRTVKLALVSCTTGMEVRGFHRRHVVLRLDDASLAL